MVENRTNILRDLCKHPNMNIEIIKYTFTKFVTLKHEDVQKQIVESCISDICSTTG